MNVVVPLQIGARDVAYPVPQFAQLLAIGGGRGARHDCRCSSAISQRPAGWPIRHCPSWDTVPTVGVDYYIWSLQMSGLGTSLTGINFVVTILRMRAPGMNLMKMPVFVWTALITNILIVAVVPGANGHACHADYGPLPRTCTSSRTSLAATR